MAYRLRRKQSVKRNLRAVASDQIDKALDEIADASLDREETVHQVRKRSKKLRGLVRLVRPAFDDYARENRLLRDAARDLSDVRDAHVLLETFDELLDYFDDQVDPSAFASARRALVRQREQTMRGDADLDQRLERFATRMRQARARAADWKLDDSGFAAIGGGLEKTYRRGRKAMRKAYAEPSGARFHEWRKRVKYHWYHLRLLRRLWPDLMNGYCRTADELSDLLGDEHDLVVLRETLRENPGAYGDRRSVEALIGLVDRRREMLQAEAHRLGSRLYAEKPGRMRKRFGAYWHAWRNLD
jgi:CHAD domain-containing protein